VFHPVYHPVIFLPNNYEVYDFTKGYDPNRTLKSEYGVGKYNEHRPGMYQGDHFEKDRRTVHIGIDIAAPIGTNIHAFSDGIIYKQGYNELPWDYGTTIITEHIIDGTKIYALHGHLSKISLTFHNEGDVIKRGTIIGSIGNKDENGGWNPHLHFQLSYNAPNAPDLPGVVSLNEREEALQIYPDPQMVLGKLYE
jgi:peptidoglycan LD-endopeptidase LytH